MGIANIFATTFDAFADTLKKPMSSFSFLETADQEHTIVAKDGSLMSVVKIDGIKQVLGKAELDNLIKTLTTKLSVYFGKPGYAIQVWFSRDPDLAQTAIRRQLASARGTAATLRLDLKDLFDEKERHLPNFVVHESFYMALWTRLSVMTKQERQRARVDAKPPKLWPTMADAQDMFRSAKPLVDRHRAFVANFIQDLKEVDIRAKTLGSHEAIQAVKWSLNPDLIDSDWKPTLVGDKTPMRRPEIASRDASHLLWPRLDEQLFDREAERINPRIVRVGSRYWAGVDMTIGPQEVFPFTTLLARMIEIKEFPWRVSFLIESDGLSSLGVKAFLAGIFTITNSENRAIREAIKQLRELQTFSEVMPTRLRISFATWAPNDDLRLIEERSSRLQRAVESWGYCNVSATSGDPLAGVMSSALGIDVASTAPSGCAPLDDVIRMLPWDRDASPWATGSVMFRTPDGRIWPFQPGSSLQDTFVDIVFAPPGKGKSVYLNTINMAMCLSASATQGIGGAKLPRIAIIDVGPSSAGLVSLLKEALPPDRRHEAEYRRLRMTKEFAINPFDTQLGCRVPFPVERSFLVNFLTALGTPAGDDSPPSGLNDIAGFCIDALYRRFNDQESKSQPKKYIMNVDHLVDKAIRDYNIEINKQTVWWDVVDALFLRGDEHHAIMAQRHAVPRLEDIGTVINDPKIKDVFGSARADNQEPTLAIFERMFIAALSEYPILQCETRFDLGDSRVVSLDLDEVAPRGGKPAEKQTALMYMLARFVLAKDFYLNRGLVNATMNGLPLIPDAYKEHHTKRIMRIGETPKRLVYDEFHRTSSSKPVREQVLIDIREGRKWNVHIALVSQLLGDFDKDMVDMATSIIICGVGNEREAANAASVFNISATGRDIMARRLNGPSARGAPFLAVLYLKEGKHEHLLINTLGPNELWAFSTTSEDAALRNRLYETIGATEARRRLAKRFPNGSAKGEIERRLAIAGERGEREGMEANDGVIDEIAKEILDMRVD